jgi:hypothetical protein
MGVALLLLVHSMHDHRLGLMLAPLTTHLFASFHIQPWHLPFTKPREAILTFLLTFLLLASSQVLMSSSRAPTLQIPETRENSTEC